MKFFLNLLIDQSLVVNFLFLFGLDDDDDDGKIFPIHFLNLPCFSTFFIGFDDCNGSTFISINDGSGYQSDHQYNCKSSKAKVFIFASFVGKLLV